MNFNSAEAGSKCCKARKCWMIPFIILGIVLIKGALTMVVWNALVPDLFHGPVLSYFQAVGLVVLSKLLFGCGFKPCMGHGRFGPPWKRLEGLTPEERAKIKEELRNCCE